MKDTGPVVLISREFERTCVWENRDCKCRIIGLVDIIY